MLRKGGVIVIFEMVRDNWVKIIDWLGFVKEKIREENMIDFMIKIEEVNVIVLESKSLSMKEKIKLYKIVELSYIYEVKDVILYVFGVGVTV